RNLTALARLALPGIERDAVDPGREARLEAEALQVAPREHEGVLGEVVGERRVATGEAPQHRAHARLVPLDERRESAPVVALEDREDQLGVRRRRSIGHEGVVFGFQALRRVSMAHAKMSASPISPGISPIDQLPWISSMNTASAMPSATSTIPPR